MERNMNQIISLGKMIVENGEDKVFFDCGPSVLKGVFTEVMIPENFRHNYKDIISKSFSGYTDESINISGKFAHSNFSSENKYIIEIYFNTKFYSFNKQIEIALEAFNKDRVDYLEEKITQLTSKMESMELLLTQLMSMTINKERLIPLMSSKEIEDNESTETRSIEDLSDSDEEEQMKKKKTRPVNKSNSGKVSKKN